jgi:hypothetical protein
MMKLSQLRMKKSLPTCPSLQGQAGFYGEHLITGGFKSIFGDHLEPTRWQLHGSLPLGHETLVLSERAACFRTS